jgi:hypothetical protein
MAEPVSTIPPTRLTGTLRYMAWQMRMAGTGAIPDLPALADVLDVMATMAANDRTGYRPWDINHVPDGLRRTARWIREGIPAADLAAMLDYMAAQYERDPSPRWPEVLVAA